MRLLIAAALALPMVANASCWTVKDLKGSSYSEREGYSRIDDAFSGTFTIVIDGDNATVLYDGLDGGGMVYRAMSKNVVVGLTTEPGKHAMETWVVQPDGVVLEGWIQQRQWWEGSPVSANRVAQTPLFANLLNEL